MKYLLDTCVMSETINPKANINVIFWLENQDENDLYLSILTFGEITKGIVKSVDEAKGKPIPVIDGLIVASELVHNCTVVTRNTLDMGEV